MCKKNNKLNKSTTLKTKAWSLKVQGEFLPWHSNDLFSWVIDEVADFHLGDILKEIHSYYKLYKCTQFSKMFPV